MITCWVWAKDDTYQINHAKDGFLRKKIGHKQSSKDNGLKIITGYYLLHRGNAALLCCLRSSTTLKAESTFRDSSGPEASSAASRRASEHTQQPSQPATAAGKAAPRAALQSQTPHRITQQAAVRSASQRLVAVHYKWLCSHSGMRYLGCLGLKE